MNRSTLAAFRAAALESLPLPLDVPRNAWPELIDSAARALLEAGCGCAELADDLHRIAGALRAEVTA